MKSKMLVALLLFAATGSLSARYSISIDSNRLTVISFTNYFYNGVCTVEGRDGRRWVPLKNFFTTERVGQVKFALPTNYARLRLKCVDVSPGNAFTRLAQSYGTIHTIAGMGGGPVTNNAWLPQYEGAYATNVVLSDPRYATTDDAGTIYVVERAGHAVDRITSDGRIHTVVGTHVAGDSGQLPGQTATNFLLRSPTAIYIAKGNLFVLDAGNNRIVQVGLTDGTANILQYDFTSTGVGLNSAGLWVDLGTLPTDLPEAFFGSGTQLKHLEDNVISVAATNFLRISHVTVDPRGRTIVSDSADNRVYRVRGSGLKEPVAGTGFQAFPGGRTMGDAEDVALPGVSSIWHLPIGGYLLSLDEGAKIYYVDADDQAAPLVYGAPGIHAGDGEWFRARRKEPKISNALSVSLAPNGDMIILEREGFIRKIDFLRPRP